MYEDAIKRWNCFIGCYYDCEYCKRSFQAQMKRQKPVIDRNGKKRGCQDCYDYIPHFHEERLDTKKYPLPRTKGDEFIWACSSGDISFAKKTWINKIIGRIRELPNRTFLFQTKAPICFNLYDFPDNVLLGITLETNRDEVYELNKISKAPLPSFRKEVFSILQHRRKVITIEPILDFDLDVFVDWIRDINPERVYIGYDTKKCYLPEPDLIKTKLLIKELKKITKVKPKLLR